MYEKTKTGKEDETNKEGYLTEFMTEENYYVTINLNSSKNKIIFNACIQEIGNFFYSKEYILEELLKYKIFQTENNLEKIYELISKNVYYQDVNAKINSNNNLELTIRFEVDSGIRRGEKIVKQDIFELNKIERSKEEIINMLMDKVDFLIHEKKNYLQSYKVKKFIDDKKQNTIIKRINLLEKNLDILEKKSKLYIESNLLSCSNIINTLHDWNLIIERLKKIEPKYNNILFKLVYRATRDGDLAENFHKKCDTIGPNITLVLTKDNHRFGGFTINNWEHLKIDINEDQPEIGSGKSDVYAFCFSIDLHKIYNNNNINNKAIFCCNKYGPTFCRNIFSINDNMLTKGGYCLKKNCSYFEGQEINYEISGGKKVFGINEVEVLEILFV